MHLCIPGLDTHSYRSGWPVGGSSPPPLPPGAAAGAAASSTTASPYRLGQKAT